MEEINIKCPNGPRELLMKYEVDETIKVDSNNLMCLKCSFCTRMGRKQDPTIKRYIHKYNLLGELVENYVERY